MSNRRCRCVVRRCWPVIKISTAPPLPNGTEKKEKRRVFQRIFSPFRTSIPAYYLPIPAVSMGAHVDENAKRAHYAGLNAQFLPLGIDVKKEQPLYQPATEAISPINDDTKFDTHLRDTTVIRNSISKLDSEIGMTQEKLHRAKLSRVRRRRENVNIFLVFAESSERNSTSSRPNSGRRRRRN